MVNLTIPSFSFSEVFDDCIFNTDKYTDYLIVKKKLVEANENYISCFQKKKGNEIPSEVDASANIKQHELLYLYNKKLTSIGHLARKYYNAIKNSAQLCPFCGVNQVKTLEHFLPKSHYSFYSISPSNLIPCCYDCNLGHGADIDMTDETTIHLHPYFDEISNVSWLKVEIEIINNEPIFIFEVNENCELSDVLISRLKKHHSMFNLGDFYSKIAGPEFNGICNNLVKAYNTGGVGDVLYYLQDQHDSYKLSKWNFWKPPFFMALKNSDWIKNKDFLSYKYE
jgi:hypothetical protein